MQNNTFFLFFKKLFFSLIFFNVHPKPHTLFQCDVLDDKKGVGSERGRMRRTEINTENMSKSTFVCNWKKMNVNIFSGIFRIKFPPSFERIKNCNRKQLKICKTLKTHGQDTLYLCS